MRVLNVHKRIINQPLYKLERLLKTLATENDMVWPREQWPAMKFKQGLKVGARGGHGPIRYFVEKNKPNEILQFRFSKPYGFNGIHKFEMNELTSEKTEIKHTVDMHTVGKGTLIWFLAIRSLHNSLIEEVFDKLENNFSETKESIEWSFWVKFIRKQIAKKPCFRQSKTNF
ncbi:MAG: hypothetical protein P8H93_02720 [Polaribacter sp.]|jgi:hypothetical protein|nr:hypothetical protein [Polaribacter sp.]